MRGDEEYIGPGKEQTGPDAEQNSPDAEQIGTCTRSLASSHRR